MLSALRLPTTLPVWPYYYAGLGVRGWHHWSGWQSGPRPAQPEQQRLLLR
eukprot:COSAG03_NODE_21026_length_310_cov_0.729858_1_plen_49_part_01